MVIWRVVVWGLTGAEFHGYGGERCWLIRNLEFQVGIRLWVHGVTADRLSWEVGEVYVDIRGTIVTGWSVPEF